MNESKSTMPERIDRVAIASPAATDGQPCTGEQEHLHNGAGRERLHRAAASRLDFRGRFVHFIQHCDGRMERKSSRRQNRLGEHMHAAGIDDG